MKGILLIAALVVISGCSDVQGSIQSRMHKADPNVKVACYNGIKYLMVTRGGGIGITPLINPGTNGYYRCGQ